MSSVAEELPSARDSQKLRLASVDFLRFLACFGIVWAHSLGAVRPELALVGYEALALFCILMAYYSVKSVEGVQEPGLRSRSPEQVSRWLYQRRVGRIALPWLFWCGFYLLLEVVITGDMRSILIVEDPYSLLVGPVIHLWFLPFAFIASGVFLLPSRRLDTPARVIWACLAAVPFSMTLFWLHDMNVLPEPFVQWAFAAPSFLFGILVALGERHRVERYAWAFFLTVCVVFIIINQSYWPKHVLFAAIIFGLAKLIRLPSTPLLKNLGALALGIYLIHPFHMAVVFRFAGSGLDPIVSAFLVFAMSCVSVFILMRIPFLRRVV